MLPATLDRPSRASRGSEGFVCACLQVTEQQLLAALSSATVRSLRDLRRTLGAGDGCTACHDRLRSYLDAGGQPSCPPICSAR